jgi:hypothetical protein
MTSPEVTENDITGTGTGTGNEKGDNLSRFLPVFPAFFTELLYILRANNGFVNPTNRSPSDI